MNQKIKHKLEQTASSKVTEVDLWQKINFQLQKEKRIKAQPWHGSRALKTSLGLAVLTILAMAALPQGRALAQNIINQIGNITFIQQPNQSLEAPAADKLLAPDPSEMSDIEREALENYGLTFSESLSDEAIEELYEDYVNLFAASAEEAEAKLDMTVFHPTYIPSEYTFSKIEAHDESPYGVKAAYTVFVKNDEDGKFISALSLTQTYMPDDVPEQFGDWVIGEQAIISDVTVRDFTAKYVQRAVISVNPMDILSWSEDGFDFSLIVESGQLSLEELLQIADGLE